MGGGRQPGRRRGARHPRQGNEGGRARRRLARRTHAVESVGDPGRRAPGDLLRHLHDAALARGRQQGVAADDAQLHHRGRPRAAPSGRAGDGAALDGHRLHRARRFPRGPHLRPRRALAAAALATALAAPFLFVGLGRAPFDDPGEGMHAEIARELAASGDPLRLTLGGVRYVDKPPLLYLLLAGAFVLGGAGEATARAVPALGALVAVAATAWLAARLMPGTSWGVLAGVALLTSCGFFAYGRYVRPESIFLAALSGGFALLLAGVITDRRGLAILGLGVLGLAALAKDPLGALLPPLAVGLALALAGPARPLAAWLPWPGVVVLVIVGFAWYAAVAVATPGFTWYTLVDNHVLNVARARRFPDEDVPLSALAFLVVAVLGATPWVLAAGAAMVRLARRRAWRDPIEPPWVASACWPFAALGLVALLAAGRLSTREAGARWDSPAAAAAVTALTLVAVVPCVALGLEVVATARSVKPIALELARRAAPADVVVHEGPLENSGALEWYSGRRPVILDGRRSVLGFGATQPESRDPVSRRAAPARLPSRAAVRAPARGRTPRSRTRWPSRARPTWPWCRRERPLARAA